MKVLVTGAGGFLGHRVVERLAAHGYTDVRCLLRSKGKSALLDSTASRFPTTKARIRLRKLKFADGLCPRGRRSGPGFYLASAMKGGVADMFQSTVVGGRNLLDAIGHRKPMRIVLVSPFGVYGVAGMRRGAQVDESTPLEPNPAKRDVYSFTKLRQEQLFREAQERFGL